MTECTIKAQSCGPNNSERTTEWTFLKYFRDVTFLMANVGTTKHTWIHMGYKITHKAWQQCSNRHQNNWIKSQF